VNDPQLVVATYGEKSEFFQGGILARSGASPKGAAIWKNFEDVVDGIHKLAFSRLGAQDMMLSGCWKIKEAISFAIAMDKSPRTALLLRCTKPEAALIREQAAAETRSVSGCVWRMLERSLWIEEKFAAGLRPANSWRGPSRRRRAADERAAVLLRCSEEQAERVRRAAARRKMSISAFALFSIRRCWRAIAEAMLKAPAGPESSAWLSAARLMPLLSPESDKQRRG